MFSTFFLNGKIKNQSSEKNNKRDWRKGPINKCPRIETYLVWERLLGNKNNDNRHNDNKNSNTQHHFARPYS